MREDDDIVRARDSSVRVVGVKVDQADAGGILIRPHPGSKDGEEKVGDLKEMIPV